MHTEVITETTAVIALDKHIFGGPQAVNFTAAIKNHLQEGVKNFIFDCSQVEIMNSSGLGMIVSVYSAAGKHGGSCVVALAPDKITELLKITRLDSVIRSYATIDDAVAAVQ